MGLIGMSNSVIFHQSRFTGASSVEWVKATFRHASRAGLMLAPAMDCCNERYQSLASFQVGTE